MVKIRFGHELTGSVIPDAWILLERLRGKTQIPIFLEIDRGMEFQKRFKEHIRSRILFYEEGGYTRMFGSESVRIYYATTGQAPEYRERRRQTMCLWTRQVLDELRLPDWADVFRFASVEFDKLYDLTLFEEPVWYRPDSPAPGPLLTR